MYLCYKHGRQGGMEEGGLTSTEGLGPQWPRAEVWAALEEHWLL